MFKIGNLEFSHVPVLLSPMEEVSDHVFRHFCKKYGADLMYTEFVSSDGLAHQNKKTRQKYKLTGDERPMGIQIYGHIPDAMVEAAKMVEDEKPEIIDINFGCPAKKIARRGAGCGMLRDIPALLEITSRVVKAVKTPVTVKTRLGWDHDTTPVDEIAERLQDCGIHALTIHGRTGAQQYTGNADWTLIGKIKNNPRIKIPIIGNGDVTSGEVAKEKMERHGVDAVMVGRASIGKPWIFNEIKHYLQTGEMYEMPFQEKVNHIIEHLNYSVLHRGERIGVLLMRRHLAQYFKNLADFRELKIRMLTTHHHHELIDILEEIRGKYASTLM